MDDGTRVSLPAISCTALAVALWTHLGNIAGSVGLAMLIATAAGSALAAVFTTDPLTTSPVERTLEGRLHDSPPCWT
jgi:hypothetical protein